MTDRPVVSGGKTIIPWKLGGSAQGQDNYLVYNFMKRLLIPFDQWEAYSTGVIDKKGNILVKKRDRTSRQNRSFGQFDYLMIKLRLLINTAPTAKNKLLPATAALYLLKEYQSGNIREDIDLKLFNDIHSTLAESEAPVNVVGNGAIAGASDNNPPVRKKKKIKIVRRKEP